MTGLGRATLLLAQAVAVGGLVALEVVRPPIHEPARADVVVLLSGDGARLPGALRLMDRQVAPTLLFVGQPDTLAVVDVCQKPQPFEVICVRPTPDDTRAEARAGGRIASTRHWHSMVLVTSRYHLVRARMMFRRCFAGTLDTVGDYPRYGRAFSRHEILHEWVGLLYATVLARGC